MEIKTFILTNEKKVSAMGYNGELKKIKNPSCEEFTCLRPSLIVDLLNTFEINKMKGLPQKFYEIGVVYEDGKEKKKLIFGIMDKKIEFSDARSFLQTLMKQTGMEFSLKKIGQEHSAFDKLRSGEVFVGDVKRGMFGKIDRKLLEQYGLEFEVYICEIDV